jgi:hypothetical protein
MSFDIKKVAMTVPSIRAQNAKLGDEKLVVAFVILDMMSTVSSASVSADSIMFFI